MNILVTGATGFIGSHLCERLLSEGYKVFGLTHSGETGKVEHIKPKPNFTLVEGNVCSNDDLKRVLASEDFDLVFHLAAQLPASASGTWDLFTTNVQGTLNILNASVEKSVKNIVISSTMAVYGQPKVVPLNERHPTKPDTFYGLSKLTADLTANIFAEKKDLNIIILRYTGVYGPRRTDTFIAYLLNHFSKNKDVEIYSPTVIKDYVYVADVVDANLSAMQVISNLGFEIFNIGGGIKYNKAELAHRVKHICGSKSEISLCKLDEQTDFDFFYDLSKASELLGYSPRSFEKCIESYWHWYKRR